MTTAYCRGVAPAFIPFSLYPTLFTRLSLLASSSSFFTPIPRHCHRHRLRTAAASSPTYHTASMTDDNSTSTGGTSTTSPSSANNTNSNSNFSAPFDPMVQYVVVRRDLSDEWPRGSMVAQAVHASVAAIWKTRGKDKTIAYCEQSGNEDDGSGKDAEVSTQMHTVVLEAKNEAALLKVAGVLAENDIDHVVWREQPEDIVTALATEVCQRSVVKKYFNKLKLFK